MAKKKYWIGIDLGGTKMLTAVLDNNFRILAEEKLRVEPSKGSKFFFNSIVKSVDEVLEESKVKLKQVGGIGIGCPGIIDPKSGKVLTSPNIPFLKKYPLAKKLQKVFKLPVVLENDVNTGLFGEHQFGAARGASNVIGIFLGTGIGGALVIDGKLYRGAGGAAGEVGHMMLDSNGPICGCGKRGCLEAYAGRVAISLEAVSLAVKQQAPALLKEAGTDVTKIKSKTLARAVHEGDTAIKDLILFKASLLGQSMANLVNLLNPEMIVLGGGLVEAMPNLIVPAAKEAMFAHAMKPMAKLVKVVPAKLKDYALVKGAAKLIYDKVNQT